MRWWGLASRQGQKESGSFMEARKAKGSFLRDLFYKMWEARLLLAVKGSRSGVAT